MTLPTSLHDYANHQIDVLMADGQWHPCDGGGWDISIDYGRDWLHFTDTLGEDVAVPLDHIRGIRARRKPMGETVRLTVATMTGSIGGES